MSRHAGPRPIAHRKEHRMFRSLCFLVLLADTLAAPLVAAADLYLVQQFEIRQGATVVLTQQRDLYVQGTKLALTNGQSWLVVRPDLQHAWLLDADRHLLSEVSMDQIRSDTAAALAKATPKGSLPPLKPTHERKTIAGLSCRVHRAAIPALSVEVCVTRDLPALEQFQAVLGTPGEITGVPLEFEIRLQPPGQPPHIIAQRVTEVRRAPLDPRLFSPRTGMRSAIPPAPR
ncbi:MAG: hypothetical protein HY713_00010 [candidate division NC10 bacterium]|nr:hypothetical protein [candidate division NC10 bacterium]